MSASSFAINDLIDHESNELIMMILTTRMTTAEMTISRERLLFLLFGLHGVTGFLMARKTGFDFHAVIQHLQAKRFEHLGTLLIAWTGDFDGRLPIPTLCTNGQQPTSRSHDTANHHSSICLLFLVGRHL